MIIYLRLAGSRMLTGFSKMSELAVSISLSLLIAKSKIIGLAISSMFSTFIAKSKNAFL
jgi:hypothetical protein